MIRPVAMRLALVAMMMPAAAIAADPPPYFASCRPLEPAANKQATMIARAKEAVVRDERFAPSSTWTRLRYRPADCRDYRHDVVCGEVNGKTFVFVVTESERKEQVLMDRQDIRTLQAMIDGLNICAGTPTK